MNPHFGSLFGAASTWAKPRRNGQLGEISPLPTFADRQRQVWPQLEQDRREEGFAETETTFAQVIVERLGVPTESVDIVRSDAAAKVVLFGMGTYGSRSISVGAAAIMHALGEFDSLSHTEIPAPHKLADVRRSPELEVPFHGRVTAPLKMLFAVADAWGLTTDQIRVLLDLESSSELRQLRTGVTSLRGRDRKDRIRHVLRIHEILENLLGSDSAVLEWLNESRQDLGSKTPLSMIASGAMEDLITVRHYTEYLAGR